VAADPAGSALEQRREFGPEVAGVSSGACTVERRQQFGQIGAVARRGGGGRRAVFICLQDVD
jgi:hypothetical protein